MATTTPGLHVVVQERGRLTHSVDAAGSIANFSSSSALTITKPAGGTLRRATLFTASAGFSGPAQGSILLDGVAVTLDEGVPSNIGSVNYMTDVTSLLRSKVNGAPAGSISFEVAETASPSIDGVILSVIFDDPAVTSDRSVALLFGATKTSGDEFRLRLAGPVDPNSPSTILEMSLGISFGYQSGPTGQFSTVDVNGQRLTSSAGGQDDGDDADGALITVGGTGDLPSNPADPLATPSDPRDDDELYDLRPFVSSGDRDIVVATANPSNDDNILFASFVANPPISAVVEQGGGTYVALGDSYSSGEGTFAYDEHQAAQDCHRGPYAWPRLMERSSKVLTEIDHRACSGAKVEDLYRPQHQGGLVQVPTVPDPGVDLVTLTIGGNDLNFKGIVICLVAKDCEGVPTERRFTNGLNTLKADLTALYRKIRIAYPNARIVHVGYPRITPRNEDRCAWLSEQERDAADQVVRKVNTAISQAANASAFNIEYVDIYNVLDGHELCTGDSNVVPIASRAYGISASEQAHPDTIGQVKIAKAVRGKLGL